MAKQIQIDIIEDCGNMKRCNLYTGERCVRIYMHTQDYESLISDGFFIRDGKSQDSAGVINTTKVFTLKK